MDAHARLLDGLDPAQREAVLSPGAPLAIIAPAGSGKTRVLTRRIARRVLDGSADASHVLAITFTRRAAAELVRRLRDLGLRDRPTTGTFHAVAQQVLHQRWADQGRAAPTLLVNPASVMAGIVERLAKGGARPNVAEVLSEIGWARARLVSPDRYEAEARLAGRRPSVGLDTIAEVHRQYSAAKKAKRLVDFDDLLTLCTLEMTRDAAFAEVQRWRFRHLFVDEFQDLNPLQHALLEAWRGGRGDLCVVGDPNQAIYAWNGADPTWLREFATHHPGATIVRLGHSYRSSPEVLRVAHGVLATGEDPGPLPVAIRPDGGSPRVHEFADDHAEAAGIARILRAEHGPGRRWSAMAVLVRTHAQAALIEQVLRAADVPTSVRGGGLLDDPAVRAVLREAAADEPGPGGTRQLADALDDETLGQSDEPGLGGSVAVRRRLAALAWEHLAEDPGATVEQFRTWLALGGADGSSGDAVDVVTFHAAKGLEWPVVIVAGLERGLVPHSSATTRAAQAEETRLLYVALTRAQHTVHVTWARRRDGRARRPSPLLEVVTRDSALAPATAPPLELTERFTIRPDTGAAPGHDVLHALTDWRADAARAAGLPARTVCSDAALAVVARELPSTIEELAALAEVGPLAARRLGPRLLAVLAAQSASTGPDQELPARLR